MSGYSLTRQAYCDLEEAEDFLLVRQPAAARRLGERAVEVFELLARHLELGRRRPDLRGGLRSFSLGTHVVYYRITAGQVQVLRVLHGARDAPAILAISEGLNPP